MANIKISELTALTPPAAADELVVVDVSATSTKKTTVGEVVGIITGDVEVASNGTATISELPVSKLQDGAARQLLQTDAAGTGVEWTSNIALPGTLGVAGQSTLASAAVSDLTSGRVVLAGVSGELQDNAGLTFDGTQLDVGGNVVVTGDLTVQGTTTIFETETVKVEDKNIELGVVASPTDVTADGGGVTLKGATDKTINWVNATDAWTFSEHVDIASAKEYRIAGAKVLDATSLGSGVVNSSLTSVGTIGTGVWEGTAIDVAYLDSTVVTTSDTGTVTSTMLENGTIVDADINAGAAIAGTKISPNFGSQNILTTGTAGVSGVLFNGDTAAANTLDDYEEGSWTLQWHDASSGGNVASSTYTGQYVKVGSNVTCWAFGLDLDTTALTAGNVIYFSLPFAAASVTGICSIGNIVFDNVTFSGQYVNTQVGAGAARGRLVMTTSASNDLLLLVSAFSSGVSDFDITFSYRAA